MALRDDNKLCITKKINKADKKNKRITLQLMFFMVSIVAYTRKITCTAESVSAKRII